METVAFIATPATEKEFAEKIDTLPRIALIEYVKDYRLKATACDISNSETQIQQADVWNNLTFPVSPKVEQKLRFFKQKFEKEKKQTLTWNEAFMEMMKLLDEKPVIQKIVKTEICPDCVRNRENEKENYGVTLRAIPADVRKIIDARGDTQDTQNASNDMKLCEFPNCLRPAEIYHHTRRFALRQNHDPNFIRALCKPHERLAHAGLIQNEEKPPTEWLIGEQSNYGANHGARKFRIDGKVNAWRQEPKIPQ